MTYDTFELSRPKYIALLERKRDAIHQLGSGLREAVNGLDEYLSADIDAELSELEAAPAVDPNAVQRLTEDLMTANLAVQCQEENMRLFQDTFANLSPELLAYVQPYRELIDGMLMPLLSGYMQRVYIRAVRQRDDIQAALMEHEAPEAQ